MSSPVAQNIYGTATKYKKKNPKAVLFLAELRCRLRNPDFSTAFSYAIWAYEIKIDGSTCLRANVCVCVCGLLLHLAHSHTRSTTVGNIL